MVAVSLSKGLGAPGGSLLAGTRAGITTATRFRRMYGGAMRQIGIFAAAGEYTLDQGLEILAVDHENARRFAERLAASRHVQLDPKRVQTNIVVFRLAAQAMEAGALSARARERGVLVNAFGPGLLRAVTHRDVTRAQCDQAAMVLVELLDGAVG